ncbi:sensor histidine kinase [Roseovarius sp.]|uniref:sensor histidine kinase n=1 Tax=Roseovarius sp. TaxID=1486281 RepID=UPI003561B3DD
MSTFSAFDVGTLLLTVAITALVATGLLAVSALRHHREVKGLPYWTASGVFLSIAGPLFMMQHEGLTFFSVFLPNTLSLVGLFLIGVGLSRLHRQSLGHADWIVIIAVVGICGIFLLFAASGWPGIEGRITAAAAGITVTTGYIIWRLPRAFAGTLVGRSITGAAVVLIGSSLMQVINVLFISDTEATGLVQLDSLHVVFVVTQMAATITLLFALVLVVPHQLATQKEALTERIKKASEAKSRFLTGVAHDLRSPLSLISAFGEILAERLKGEEQKFVHDICLAANELNGMVESLTELARLEEGAIKLDRRPTPVRALIRDVTDAERFAAAKAGIDLRNDTPGPATDADSPGDTDLTAMINAQSLRRVVKNLVRNALSYSKQGDIVTLRVYSSRAPGARRAYGADIDQTVRRKQGPDIRDGQDTEAEPAKAKAVVITITDTGPGIEPEFMDDLFEPFARNAPETEGTGLGLAITRELVEAMSGTISVQSKLGEGTRFEIRLPFANHA